jgi:ribosomal protein L16 Arg81 hydroxylase
VQFDKNYKSHRFTVLSGEELPALLTDRLFTKEQFEQLWKKTYSEARQKNKIAKSYKASEEEVENVLMMDYSFYRAVVMAVYSFKTLQEYEAGVSSAKARPLKDFL